VSPYGHPPSPPADQTQVRFAPRDRRWLVPTLLIVLAAVSIGVAALLLGGSGAGDLFDDTAEGETDPEETSAEAVTIAEATAFDPPPGDGSEHGDEIGLVYDGQSGPDAVWDTEWYDTQNFGSLKPGVGFYLNLDEASEVTEVAIESASQGWNVEIYVASAASEDIAGWGEAAGTLENGTTGVNRVTLDEPAEGSVVLVWFTFLADETTRTGQYHVDVSEVEVLGR
jgi:eukaryotic-like serine/threonine-protein kinase